MISFLHAITITRVKGEENSKLAMVNIPVKFRRVAAAFDEVARAGRSCVSSGSEHSADLSDMVNSFLEREITEYGGSGEVKDQEEGGGEEIVDDEESETNSPDSELEDSLKNLLFDLVNDDGGVKRRILAEVEAAIGELGGSGSGSSSPGFKRRVMALLRSRGFDAGLCKSKWEKKGRCPSGDYEYIDVDTGRGCRYIVEISLAGEFTIARPTGCYASLLKHFPPIFVGRPDELKQVVRLMSNAIRESMKTACIHVPPWRRLAYMQAKWFASYKRTQNEASGRNMAFPADVVDGNRSVGFGPVAGKTMFYCRVDFAAKAGVRTGNLAAALN